MTVSVDLDAEGIWRVCILFRQVGNVSMLNMRYIRRVQQPDIHYCNQKIWFKVVACSLSS